MHFPMAEIPARVGDLSTNQSLVVLCHHGAHSQMVVGTREDMAECLQFAADGSVKADIELQPLSAINTIFERLEKGEVPSRVVLDFVGDRNQKAAAPTREAIPA